MSSNSISMKDRFFGLASRIPQRYMPRWLKLRLLIRSGLLDYAWYRHVTHQLPADVLELAEGVWNEDRPNAAHPLFHADFYRVNYKFKGSPGEALLDYALTGESLGRKPSEWFDPVHFRRMHPDAPRDRLALALYLNNWRQWPRAHPYFDAEWYVEAYPDVAETGRNPLAHFAHDGAREGREPNEFFDAAWYLSNNQDIARSGMSAPFHFSVYGSAELRSPSARFDMRRYAARFPHYRDSGLDPLGHYLAYGRDEGLDVGRLCLGVEDFRPLTSPRVTGPQTDVVIPVYRNLEETRRCIESVLASDLPEGTRILVYNDASPEPEVSDYLRHVAKSGRILLRENPANLGFVGTVNLAMRASVEAGIASAVLLLNSDTEVANDWLSRLAAHVARDPDIATVTALSNNATICSYPSIGANPMPADCSLGELDRLAARANAGHCVDIPTGVGFCMLITHESLERVGFFDEEAFGKGYGEENDFCMRCTAAGLRNVLATDVFVRHVGEVSFASSSGEGKNRAAAVIRQRYPDYETKVANHVGLDPALAARCRLTFARWRASSAPVVALITHDMGGGTERQVQAICAAMHAHVVIRPIPGHPSRLIIENLDAFEHFSLLVDIHGAGELAELLGLMGISHVQVHHLLGHGTQIRQALALSGIPYDFHIHDYYTICPQIMLTTAQHRYCGEPDAHGCNACIAERPSNGASDIINWRLHHDWALLGAARVVAPSEDAATRMQRYHPIDIVVHPHEPPIPVQAVARRASAPTGARRGPLRVVMLGVLAPHKGKYLVLDLLAAVAARGLPLQVRHLGYLGLTDGELTEEMEPLFESSGWYREDELPGLIEAAQPDVFLFASSAPETYSFTLSAAMRTGLPIAAPDLGAFRERLRHYPGAMIFPHTTGGELLADELLRFCNVAMPEAEHAH